MSKINMRNIIISTIMVFLTTTGIHSQTLPKFTITTENWKPFQYMENNEIKGRDIIKSCGWVKIKEQIL